MRKLIKRIDRWLLPSVTILFILEILLLPLVITFTWSDRSESPSHILTYTQGKLTWDSATGIRSDGSAELSLFDAIYGSTVDSQNGESVVAPGTESFDFIRLKNDENGAVNYTAVLYELKTDPALPAKAQLSGNDFTDLASYPLPEGIEEDRVIRAVTGTIQGKQIQDFDIDWQWPFEMGTAQDMMDTDFGNHVLLDRITVGLYIVVEDENSYAADEPEYIVPDVPNTGDDSRIVFYLGLMAVSGVMLILLLWERRREKRREHH